MLQLSSCSKIRNIVFFQNLNGIQNSLRTIISNMIIRKIYNQPRYFPQCFNALWKRFQTGAPFAAGSFSLVNGHSKFTILNAASLSFSRKPLDNNFSIAPSVYSFLEDAVGTTSDMIIIFISISALSKLFALLYNTDIPEIGISVFSSIHIKSRKTAAALPCHKASTF